MSLLQCCWASLLVLGFAERVNAQALPADVAVDVSAGLGHGFGGRDLPDRTLVVAGLTVIAPVHRFQHGALVAGVHTSLDLLWSTTDCLQVPPNGITGPGAGGCRTYPSDVAVALLGGWATRANQASGTRLLLGPAFVNTSDDVRQLALLTRVDAAEGLTPHIAFVFWGQGLLPTADRGERRVSLSGGIGLRLH